ANESSIAGYERRILLNISLNFYYFPKKTCN
ncbi:MAG: hypothetical protein ACI91V_001033, partial [Lentimonas sp.]